MEPRQMAFGRILILSCQTFSAGASPFLVEALLFLSVGFFICIPKAELLFFDPLEFPQKLMSEQCKTQHSECHHGCCFF